jgi:uncharacterized protein (DUF1330 family)
MAKAYWVVCYRKISDPAARDAYTRLAVPAVLASGGRYPARGDPAKTYEGGIDQRTVVVEFDSLAQAIRLRQSGLPGRIGCSGQRGGARPAYRRRCRRLSLA